MKKYEFCIYEAQKDKIFSPIRSKKDYIMLITEVIKAIELNDSVNIPKSSASLIVEVDKMSRVHIFDENKYFSINFPFSIVMCDSGFRIISKSFGELNPMQISLVRSVFSEYGHFDESCVASFADKILDHEVSAVDYWPLIKEFLCIESGYIRFDHDSVRENGSIHPLYHLDVFYSANSTFKLGLNKNISKDDFSDILNLNKNCFFCS